MSRLTETLKFIGRYPFKERFMEATGKQVTLEEFQERIKDAPIEYLKEQRGYHRFQRAGGIVCFGLAFPTVLSPVIYTTIAHELPRLPVLIGPSAISVMMVIAGIRIATHHSQAEREINKVLKSKS